MGLIVRRLVDIVVAVQAGSVPGQKVAQGRFFLASTGRMTLAVAGNLRATLENPAGSGRTIAVARVGAFATSTGWAMVRMNPTSGLPAAVRPVQNAVFGGGLAAVGVVKVDTSAATPLGGGVDTGLVIGVPANNRLTLDMPPLVLAPGVTLGINVPFAGAADAVMSVYWWENDE